MFFYYKILFFNIHYTAYLAVKPTCCFVNNMGLVNCSKMFVSYDTSLYLERRGGLEPIPADTEQETSCTVQVYSSLRYCDVNHAK